MAEALYQELERLVYGVEGALALAWLHRARAFRAPYVSYPGSSGKHFALSADAFSRAGDVRNACLQRANYGAACHEYGDWKGAEGALRPAIVDAERMGAKHIVSSAQRDLGYALARCGHVAEAREMLEQAVAEFAAHGDRRKRLRISKPSSSFWRFRSMCRHSNWKKNGNERRRHCNCSWSVNPPLLPA